MHARPRCDLINPHLLIIHFPSSVAHCHFQKKQSLHIVLLILSVVEKSMVICERKRGTISCENGKIIQVLDANYGRLNKISCTHKKMGNINCGSNNSLKVVQDKCNHKSSCELLASNGEFHGDPCGGTHKYLEVKYRCLE